MKRTIVLLIIAIIIVLSAKFPYQMLNPGELIEVHQKIKNDCTACHNPFWGVETSRCINCHKLDEIGVNDSSKNTLADNKEMVLFHGKLKNQECISCHTDHKGMHPQLSINHFDHEFLSAETKPDCNSCHSQPTDKLHNQISVDCNSCHNPTSWKFSGTFNHNMITDVNKTNCTSCHQQPSDSFHQSSKDNCIKCHSIDKWSPSNFNHSQYFVLDKKHNAKCIICHTNNNYSAYTCYGCHEHSENNIADEHQEEGIYNFTDCVSCHPSGNEHDIRNSNERNRSINQDDANKLKEYLKSNKEHKKERDDDDD